MTSSKVQKKTPTVESKTRRLNSFYQPNKPEEARLTHFSEVTNSRPDAEAPQMHDQSEAKPRVKTDPPRDETITAVNRGATFQTSLDDEPNHAILRYPGFAKQVFEVTTVSQYKNQSGSSKHPSSSWRSVLRLNDEWHSGFASVQRLLDHLQLHRSGSLKSATNYCYRLATLCRDCGLDPDQLAKLGRDKIEGIVQRHCDGIIRKGMSKQYARIVMACLKTFFACNGFNRENSRELRLKGYYLPSRTDTSEYVPTLKEALTMADRAGSKRNRAIILTLVTSGLRNTAVRALKVGHVLAEPRGKRPLLIKVEPKWNDRISGACKGSIPYYTFAAEVASDAIESMLRERKSIFGPLSSEEPLFASNYNQLPRTERPMKSLSAKVLLVIVKKAAKAADIEKWKNVCVKTMRKVFETALRNPLADGTQMDHKDQEFLMGHILPGSQENYYDRTKVERLRELYSKVVFEDTSHQQKMTLEVTRSIAKALGLDVSKICAIRVQELGRPLTSQEEEELLEQEIKTSQQKPSEQQKPVHMSELDEYLQSGWTFVANLPDGRVLMSKKRCSGEHTCDN